MTTQIINARIILPYGGMPGVCRFTDGIIDYIGETVQEADVTVDAQGAYLLPGFIDIHCHGGAGFDFMDASPEEMREISRFHLSHGTTTLVPTTMTDRTENIRAALDRLKALYASGDALTLTGAHLEGPWLSPAQCGAQDTSKMQLPSKEALDALLADYPFISRISAAPELPWGMELGDYAKSRGLVVALAHTDADYDTAVESADHGYTLMTHLFSGMKSVVRVNAYRVAGAIEAGLVDDRLVAEIIADGKHLPAGLLKLIEKCKSADGICLITDAMRGAGLANGQTTMLGRMDDGVPCLIDDDVAKLPDCTAFAGSTATTDRLVRTMHDLAGSTLSRISRMASATPARVMGFDDRGTIELGKRSDLVLMDDDLRVKTVFLNGRAAD
ncbi:MAG: amidohydrolase family protein [Clostridia bacterium]|nr:amidohydrolase family protein [Clostridia bacterium]